MFMGMKYKPQRDITLGALWFTVSLYFIQPLLSFIGFIQFLLLFFGSKYFIDKAKVCWFPTEEDFTDDSRKNP